MLKRIALMACFVGSGLMGFVAQAQGNPGEGLQQTIQGKVQFERRMTWVPMAICENEHSCVKSEPYWSMVIQQGNIRYEIDEVFALGNPFCPDALELSGVKIRPGARVSLEGRVEALTQEYHVVSKIEKISVLDPESGE